MKDGSKCKITLTIGIVIIFTVIISLAISIYFGLQVIPNFTDGTVETGKALAFVFIIPILLVMLCFLVINLIINTILGIVFLKSQALEKIFDYKKLTILSIVLDIIICIAFLVLVGLWVFGLNSLLLLFVGLLFLFVFVIKVIGLKLSTKYQNKNLL